MDNKCKKRDSQTGELCGRSEATYGVTLNSRISKTTTYTIMVCKRHFDDYLSDPAAFTTSHEIGGLKWLMVEVSNVEPIRRTREDSST
jgi:hypothetical protein